CSAEGEAVPGRRMQVDEYAEERLPRACGSNLYLNVARPYRKESGSLACPEVKPRVEVITEADGVYLLCDLGGRAGAVETVAVTTDRLGTAFEPELPYENPDGTPLCVECDFFGNPRPAGRMTAGPLQDPENGGQRIRLIQL
ncbi:MAG: hypothetical protein KBA30_11040, partial [Clostridia bacterium]|nr:hypothetical protein [Clostridia bacterium]